MTEGNANDINTSTSIIYELSVYKDVNVNIYHNYYASSYIPWILKVEYS